MNDALKKTGSTLVKYTEYPDVGHNSWNQAYKEAELLPWLFGQRRMNCTRWREMNQRPVYPFMSVHDPNSVVAIALLPVVCWHPDH